jgi:glycosyltransferase involved in cell wall biosynthesis
VVLCTLGRSAHLPAAVAAIRAQSLPGLDIVVVDNDPGSGAVDRALGEVDDPRVRIVPERRRGLSTARNTGLAAAYGRIVAFTDDDAEPAPDWVERLLAGFEQPEVVGVTGRVLPVHLADGPQRWFELGLGFDKGDRPRAWSLAPGGDGADDPLFPYTAGQIGSGNNMAFRRSWLLETGGFDEWLGAGTPTRGGEDLDVLRRGVLDGGTVRYEPTAVVRHHHRDSLDALTRQAFAWGTGMAAQLTRYALANPVALLRIARRVPRGVAVLLRADSPKNRDRPADFPGRVIWAERAGYLTGPVLLLASSIRRAFESRAADPRVIVVSDGNRNAGRLDR